MSSGRRLAVGCWLAPEMLLDRTSRSILGNEPDVSGLPHKAQPYTSNIIVNIRGEAKACAPSWD